MFSFVLERQKCNDLVVAIKRSYIINEKQVATSRNGTNIKVMDLTQHSILLSACQ
jgi:hypothetical protein